MHLAWALLILLNGKNKLLRLGAWFFVALTVFATIGLGEHYFSDLIVAVPFTLVVQTLCEFMEG